MITPSFLKSGDKIGVVAPARWVTEEEMKLPFETFRQWGLEVVVAPNIYTKNDQFSGTDEERAAGFQQMLDDSSIKAIFCARGGYGSIRTLQQLKLRKFSSKPKWIVGFSDATVFHSYFNQQLGVKTIHAPMLANIKIGDANSQSLDYLRKVLFGERFVYSFPSHPLNREGRTEGIMTGGNLSVLYSLRGTPADIETDDKMLFIEDVDEYLYHVDRMMMNLQYGGKLDNLKALIVGSFSEMKDNKVPFGKTIEEIIAGIAEDYDFPLCFGFPAGHETSNYPFIMGQEFELIIDKDKTIVKNKI